eukprot:TRINITY_DN9067_c0_g1_i1.p1 TRINITY_DN9067_c0_g1~~TRINITY_DN9067_c0_g1_i1.p1  ORF type:complete len:741 (+),score=141.75 TRINITY_DN9067_c0_g1_i1:53-2275(+)
MDRKAIAPTFPKSPKIERDTRRAPAKPEMNTHNPNRNKQRFHQSRVSGSPHDQRAMLDPFPSEEDFYEYDPSTGQEYLSHSISDHVEGSDISELDLFLIDKACSPNQKSKNKGRRSKATSINHLLQFNIAPAEIFVPPPRRRVAKPKPFDKERFVQANFQFFVKPEGEYYENIIDPDALVKWDDILYVKYTSTEITECSICISRPIAAQMTKCGHIFCASCISQYLSYEKGPRCCPLCIVFITENSLKPVVIEQSQKMTQGGLATMSLLQRSKSSITPLPRVYWTSLVEEKLLQSCDAFSHYGRLCLGTDYAQVLESQEQQVDEAIMISQAFPEEHDGVIPFLESIKKNISTKKRMAISMLETSSKPKAVPKKSVSKTQASTATPTKPIRDLPMEAQVSESAWTSGRSLENELDLREEREPASTYRTTAVPEDWWAEGINKSQETPQPPGVGLSEIASSELSSTASVQLDAQTSSQLQQQSNHFYLYQCNDGQRIYLHPLCMKMLTHQYGSMESFPEELSAEVNSIEMMTMNEENRKRYKFLGHLPLTTEFQFCELNMERIVSRSTLRKFMGDLKQRRAKFPLSRQKHTQRSSDTRATDDESLQESRSPSQSPAMNSATSQTRQSHHTEMPTLSLAEKDEGTSEPIDIAPHPHLKDTDPSSSSPLGDQSPSNAISQTWPPRGPPSSVPTSRPSFADALMQDPALSARQKPNVASSSKEGKSSGSKKGKTLLFSTSAGHRY